jgi:hypothetical protein
MKRLALSASALALLSGVVLAVPAQAASYNRHGHLTAFERAAIARNAAHVRHVRWRARSDGHVSLWERMKIRAAVARHKSLAYRLRHN